MKEWRKAYPEIEISEEALKQAGPFPSLSATDFGFYVKSKYNGGEVAEFVFDLTRECAWAYGNWQKAQRDGDPKRLLDDIERACGEHHPDKPAFVQFLRDYRKANNIGGTSEEADWKRAIEEEAKRMAVANSVNKAA